jgi:hypothetical protein
MDARALQIAVKALPTFFPVAGLIMEAMTRSQAAVTEAETLSDDSLAKEAARQQVVMEFQAHSARVAQELAIAERMATADDVEIEEYYEGTGKATAGMKFDSGAAVVGLSGEGRRVTRRIIKLKGLASSAEVGEST